MDAFKLLTRSTRFSKSATAPAAESTARLPSTGKAANPQLFRTAAGEKLESEKNKKKRKRGAAAAEEDGENDAAELDFFQSSKRSAAAKAESSAPAKGDEEHTSDQDDESDEEDEMDEVERRTILNSHKIKVTDLRDLDEIQPQPAATTDSKKKKKKQKKEETPVLSKKEQKRARRVYPQPLTSFKELRTRYKISSRLAENVAEQGFTVPTEVQLGTLPLLLGDSSVSKSNEEPDLLVVAPTGSGKTLSFLVPVINKIVRHHHSSQSDEHGILSIIVAPTKELASQIVNEGRKLVAGTGVKITLMKKGMRVVERDDENEANVLDEDSEASGSDDEEDDDDKPKKASSNVPVTKSDILVTTPLQLVNALSEHQTKPMAKLPLVRSLVLDEADVLLDPLFREQTLDIWRSCIHPDLRVSLWSATMGSNIDDLTRSTIKERQADIGQTSTTQHPLVRLVVGLKDSAIPNIEHKLVYAATEQGKLLGLRQLLRPAAATASDVRLRPPFLIFTQTIPRAIALHSELKYDIPAEAGGSSRIAVLHSDLSDTQRSEIMRDFRKGEIWILVTTDLLARGVDFRGINGVVNYDIPNSAAVYVHRVGRTGRAGREGGIAVTYYTKEDIPYVKSIANIIDVSEKLRGTEGEKSIQKWLLDSLPDLSKKNKKELKKHGVKARQVSKQVGEGKEGDGKGLRRMRISTKSGFERRMENRRKGAIEASRSRKANEEERGGDVSDAGSWNGLQD
ncbi:ATP-dependent RNA helicase rok1 [Penicillium daleae]|uniref:ATP-dependent RNA helicase ROK1 n=1 Tax=Penicillium daleae TaxID=63821 RepID=A0AAD6C571_9EURO|nr:ATP-dependent RNA helicase rok1 [Penicillium daleae]KAJ5450240.1 ATP-dependent RNA helicase rok1 [Penicillium daleae]